MERPVLRCCVVGALGFEREMETLVSRVIPDARRYGRAKDIEVFREGGGRGAEAYVRSSEEAERLMAEELQCGLMQKSERQERGQTSGHERARESEAEKEARDTHTHTHTHTSHTHHIHIHAHRIGRCSAVIREKKEKREV